MASNLNVVSLEERARALAERNGGPAGVDALTVTQFYGQVERAVLSAFSRSLWITGEIRSLKVLPKGHCFIDLVDPANANEPGAPVLSVKCWSTKWRSVKNSLDQLGVNLEVGMVVRVRGDVGFYKARGTVDFTLSELDTEALLGKVAAERARLIQALVDEDLFDRQKRLSSPLLPLRIGLVASPGTEGCNDFLGQLEASGMAFAVTLVPSAVQGADAPASIARAIAFLQTRPLDVVVLVRGGGSKADLATFDTEPVVRAVATSNIPVVTGIGHTGDLSLADEVAHRYFITPTECGQSLGRQVREFWERNIDRGARIARLAAHRVEREEQVVGHHRQQLGTFARLSLVRHGDRLLQRRGRLVELARRKMETEAEGLAQRRRLLNAYDYQRLLERGYSLTRDANGVIVRSVADLAPGSTLVTQLADGAVTSSVVEVASAGVGEP